MQQTKNGNAREAAMAYVHNALLSQISISTLGVGMRGGYVI